MDALELPLSHLSLRANSRAEDLGFVALADVARATEDLDDVLIIGGQMISLHAYRWGMGAKLFRESKDADVGMPEAIARDAGIVERLESLGYRQRSGGEFVRVVADDESEEQGEAAIDVLVPARTSRARASRRVSERLVTTEVPGLITALIRSPVKVALSMTRLNESRLEARIALPDEVAAVVLRAYAWQKRLTATDAEDIERSLEIAWAAGVSPADFVSDEERVAVEIIATAFAKSSGLAIDALGSGMGRMRALMLRVLGIPPG